MTGWGFGFSSADRKPDTFDPPDATPTGLDKCCIGSADQIHLEPEIADRINGVMDFV